MVNVEADALAGAAGKARREGGHRLFPGLRRQPASFVKWWTGHGLQASRWWQQERAPSTFRFTMRPLPRQCGLLRLYAGDGGQGDFNAQMFNSFLTHKSGIEMALWPMHGADAGAGGLEFPPCGVDDLARVLRPAAKAAICTTAAGGGDLQCGADGRPFSGTCAGAFMSPLPRTATMFDGASRSRTCDGRHGELQRHVQTLSPDRPGIGHQRAVGGAPTEPTGCPTGFRADAVATAKRDLKAGETLDGRAGNGVGKLMPARDSLPSGPYQSAGARHQAHATRAAGRVLTWRTWLPKTARRCASAMKWKRSLPRRRRILQNKRIIKGVWS